MRYQKNLLLRRHFVLVILFGVAIAYPLWATDYGLTVVRDALILGIFALSLDFLWGKAGLPSFGHAAFFGLGGYVYALVATSIDPSYASVVGVAAVVVVCAAFGVVIGIFLLRAGVRGALFLIVTIAIAQIFHQVAISWSSVTGGDNGFVGLPLLNLNFLSQSLVLIEPSVQYYSTLTLAAALLLWLWRLSRGRFGRVLAAIADNELRAQTLGANAPLELTKALAISTAIAGLAGAVYCSMAGIMVPDLIGPLFSVEVVVWVLIGGRGTLLGPFIGTFIVWRLSQEISSYDPRLWPLAIGAFFILMVFLFPKELVGLSTSPLLLALRERLMRTA